MQPHMKGHIRGKYFLYASTHGKGSISSVSDYATRDLSLTVLGDRVKLGRSDVRGPADFQTSAWSVVP